MRGFPRQPADGQRDEREKNEQVEIRARVVPPPLRRLGPPLQLLGRRRARLDALVGGDRGGLEPRRVTLLSKARRDRAADDLRGLGVGQHPFEPVPDLEAKLSILDEHVE